MMNIRAVFVLLSSLGAVMFLSPEPKMRRINSEIILVEAAQGSGLPFNRQAKGAVESAKKAAEDVAQTASDYAKHTGEGIRHASSAAYDKLSASSKRAEDGARARAEDSSNAASQVRDSVARKKDEADRRIHQAYEDSVNAASGYAHHDAASVKDAADDRIHQAYDSALRAKEEASNAASDYGHRAKDSAARAKDAADQRIHQAYDDSSNAASGYAHQARDSLAGAAGKTSEFVSSRAASARDSLGDAAHSAGDDWHSLGDSMKELGKGDQESTLSKLKEKIHGAVQYQPNLGQGVGYYIPEEHEEQRTGSFRRKYDEKVEEYLEGARDSARDAMEKAAEGLDLLKNQLEELEPYDEHLSLETARNKIKHYYDTTKDVVLNALTRKEQQLGRSLDSAKRHVESYYERTKEASLESIENQKEKLGQYLDMVRLKLNAGREAVFNYAVSSKEAVVDEKNKLIHKVQEIEGEASKWGSNARDKVDQSFKQAGRWAHDKMVKLNQTEEAALRICKQWIHKSVGAVVRLLHLFVFSSVFGSALWVTFVSGFVLSRNVSRQQFGLIQSKIFPVYHRMVGAGIILLLATHMLLYPLTKAGSSEILQYYNLAACLALTLLNTFLLEPRVTKTMFDKLRLEKEEGRAVDAGQVPVMDDRTRVQMMDVGRRLEALHSYSSAANLLMLAGMTWHLWYLNCRLVI